jgi:aminoglycoside/choline kinase family phosphotransferase
MIETERTAALTKWVTGHHHGSTLTAIPGDASSRRYFRVQCADYSLIAVDAPIQSVNILGFVRVAEAFAQQGVNVPKIHEVDYQNGFLLLSDLGNTQLLQVLNEHNVDHYYAKSFDDLAKIQQVAGSDLPNFDRSMLQEELSRFHEWYLIQHLQLTLLPADMQLLNETYDRLIAQAIGQPQVCVHRDFHSRNLMLLDDDNFAVIDFQDAVRGPVTYDLVSLLRDCYVKWPAHRVYSWVDEYWHLQSKSLHGAQSREEFRLNFDWIGLQRHLKVLGTFARLYRRDNKASYLQDIPRVLNYVVEVCRVYPELKAFENFLHSRVLGHESNDISGGKRDSFTSVNG